MPWDDWIFAIMTFFNVFCDGRFRPEKPVQIYQKIPPGSAENSPPGGVIFGDRAHQIFAPANICKTLLDHCADSYSTSTFGFI